MGVTVADGGAAGAFLRLLAERAAADPAYLAWAVRTYAEAEGQPTTDVLTQLGVAEHSATDFLVSLRPAGERFAEMLTAICVRFGADEPALLTVLREVEVLDAFRSGGPHGAADADAGLLMAARMRDEGTRPRSAEVRRDDPGGAEGNDAR